MHPSFVWAICAHFTFSIFTFGLCSESVLSLEQATQKALQAHPDLQASRLKQQAADARTRQASTLLNPEFEFEGTDSEIELTLTQPLEIGGNRAARKKVASLEARAVSEQNRVLQLQIMRETRRRYADAVWASQHENLEQQQLLNAQDLYSALEERVHEGGASPLLLAKLEVEVEKAKLSAFEAERTKLLTLRRLSSLWTKDFVEIAVVSQNEKTENPPKDSLLDALLQHPSLLELDTARLRAEAEIEQIQASRIPDPYLSVGWIQDQEEDVDTWKIGLGIPLPIWNRNQGSLEAAHLDADVLTLSREAKLRDLILDLEESIMAQRSARSRVNVYQERILPAAERSLNGAVESYEEGRSDLRSLLKIRAWWLQTQREALDAQRTLDHAEARLLMYCPIHPATVE